MQMNPLFQELKQLHGQDKKKKFKFVGPLASFTSFDCHHLTLQIVLPPHLDNVRDKLAENIHELWGMNKIELGWTFGKVKLLARNKMHIVFALKIIHLQLTF